MTIIQRSPIGKPTGVYHPEPGESRHFAPTRAGGHIAPTGPDPMVGPQSTDYFANAYAANAPGRRLTP
jgi:hypothetical protein